jgi:DNA-binding response OmpR family regulator
MSKAMLSLETGSTEFKRSGNQHLRKTPLMVSLVSDAILDIVNSASVGLGVDMIHDAYSEAMPSIILIELAASNSKRKIVQEQLKEAYPRTPTLGIAQWQDLRNGKFSLQEDVDDLVFVPTNPVDLQYRLRRYIGSQVNVTESAATLTFGRISFDLQSSQIRFGDKSIRVTKREYELLIYLARQECRPVGHREIAEKALRIHLSSDTFENIINVHIARLRNKLREVSCQHYLLTERGAGFMLLHGQ